MKKNILTRLVIFMFFIPTLSALGVEYQSPRTLALGGAGRGAPLLNDSIFMNPSYGSFTQIYTLSAGYTSFDQGRNYNIAIMDARAEVFQAGAGFTKREQNNAVNIGASKVIANRLGVGVGSKFIFDNGTNNMTSNFLFSTSFIAAQWVYASLVVDNLLDGDSSTQRNLYRTFFLGFKFIPTQMVQLFFDPLYSPGYSRGKKAGYSLGAEFALLSDFYLRLGKFQDAEITHVNTRGEGFGIGAGWMGPRINFDYALNRVVHSHARNSLTTAHAFSMNIFF